MEDVGFIFDPPAKAKAQGRPGNPYRLQKRLSRGQKVVQETRETGSPLAGLRDARPRAGGGGDAARSSKPPPRKPAAPKEAPKEARKETRKETPKRARVESGSEQPPMQAVVVSGRARCPVCQTHQQRSN